MRQLSKKKLLIPVTLHVPSESLASTSGMPLAEGILAKLLERIHKGQLGPGDPINEAVIAQEFSVSRGPVREAVRRLQGLQLVTREPYLKARVVTLTREGVQELFEMRMALEGLACRLAAERMTEDEILELEKELELDRQRILAYKEGDDEPKRFDLHERIVLASRNRRITDTLCGDLYHLLRMYRRRSGAILERKSQAYAEHWQLVRAIKARDGELAESLMRSHIARAAEHLLGTVSTESDGKSV